MKLKNLKVKLFFVAYISCFVGLCGLAMPAWAETNTTTTQVPDDTTSTPSDSQVAPIPPHGDKEGLPYEELRRFAMVYAAIKNDYVEPISDEELVDAAIQGMMDSLDPHSSYLNKEDFADLEESTEGEFGGLGIEISERDHEIQIISPLEDSPAARAGIIPGDVIVRINGQNVKDSEVEKIIKQLRGDPGTKVEITVRRQNGKLHDMTMTRELIKVKSVRSKWVGSDIAYVRISQFQERTVQDLVTQLNQFKTPPKGLVLDLRNDPGGILNAAVGVVGAFVPPDSLVAFTKRRGQIDTRYHVEPADYSLNLDDPLKKLPSWSRQVPMVVLINIGSASASELVSGALQDYKRAHIMGNRSFGKGSVQVVMPFDDDTGIKLTTARYYTPKGRSIQARGITPDIVVSDTSKGDLFIFPREADLADHLTNDTNKEEVKGKTSADSGQEDLVDESAIFEFGAKDDFQLMQAINFLHGKPVNVGKPSGVGKDKKDTANNSATKAGSGQGGEAKDSKNAEANNSATKAGSGQGGEAKDGKNADAKDKEGKEVKTESNDSAHKENHAGESKGKETKDSKQSKDNAKKASEKATSSSKDDSVEESPNKAKMLEMPWTDMEKTN